MMRPKFEPDKPVARNHIEALGLPIVVCCANNSRRTMCTNFQWLSCATKLYKVVQIWPGQTVTCLHTNRPGHIWTTLYITKSPCWDTNCCTSAHTYALLYITIQGSVILTTLNLTVSGSNLPQRVQNYLAFTLLPIIVLTVTFPPIYGIVLSYVIPFHTKHLSQRKQKIIIILK
jgi:hypothetical protein